VSLLPQTLAWWFLAGLGLVALGFVCVAWIRRYRANAYRREAAAELERIAARLADPDQRVRALPTLPVLVKRTVLVRSPRTEVAALSGDEWLRFLDGTTRGTEFTVGPGRLLPTLSYSDPRVDTVSAADLDALIRLIRRWIPKHRV
jgi:hypothetical protein